MSVTDGAVLERLPPTRNSQVTVKKGSRMLRVCTGFGPAGYELYGRNFLETFDRWWPRSVELVAYTEAPVAMPRGECRSLWDCHGATEFFERHKGNLKAQGREPVPQWNAKALKKFEAGGAAWRWDALKWFRQCMIPEHAAIGLADGDVLCWLDGDVVTLSEVREGFVEKLLGQTDLVYLGRHRGSEIGFWAVRISHGTRAFLKAFAGAYRGDEVFKMKEWHSAYVFDQIRMKFQDTRGFSGPGSNGMVATSLTPQEYRSDDHVWFRTALGTCMDHLKGKRKALGRSPERRR